MLVKEHCKVGFFLFEDTLKGVLSEVIGAVCESEILFLEIEAVDLLLYKFLLFLEGCYEQANSICYEGCNAKEGSFRLHLTFPY